MMATAPRLFVGAALSVCYAVEHCFCGFRYKSPIMLKSRLKSGMTQGLFCAYCVTRGTVKYYAQIHLQVWQNSVCTGQGNLPLIT